MNNKLDFQARLISTFLGGSKSPDEIKEQLIKEAEATDPKFMLHSMFADFYNHWDLDWEETSNLIGLDVFSVNKLLSGDTFVITEDASIRIRILYDIDRFLYSCYDDPKCDLWMRKPKKAAPYKGRTPIEYLAQEGPAGFEYLWRVLQEQHEKLLRAH